MRFYPPGTRIAGRYEIAGRPLMGGMGIVYVCLDHEENRPVALKTFKPEYLPDRDARDRFLREGTAWVDLGRHPNIVRCYNVLYTDPEEWVLPVWLPSCRYTRPMSPGGCRTLHKVGSCNKGNWYAAC